MKKTDVKVGSTYLMNHTSGRITVRIEREVIRGGYGGRRQVTHWEATNLRTGRTIEVKSALKLLKEIVTV